MEYRIIVLNLKRRTDRWAYSVYNHGRQGIPFAWIERWDARDGLDWKPPDWEVGNPHPELKEVALKATDNTAFLDRDPHYLCDYCWQWSFYEAVTDIAKRDDDKLYIFMHDDYSLDIDHAELMDCVWALGSDESPFLLMQLAYNDGETFTGDRFKHHNTRGRMGSVFSNVRFVGARTPAYGDAATLMSPKGARMIKQLADKPTHPPLQIFGELAQSDTKGLYHAYPMWAYHDSPYDQDREAF